MNKKEIERKFLVPDKNCLKGKDGTFCAQGYLAITPGYVVRVRILGDRGYLTIKGPTQGITRDEFEYSIPETDARAMMLFCSHKVEKIRYYVPFEGMVWEVDDFLGLNSELAMAEIELDHEDQDFSLPDWIGDEVSYDQRYMNSSLAKAPYNSWAW